MFRRIQAPSATVDRSPFFIGGPLSFVVDSSWSKPALLVSISPSDSSKEGIITGGVKWALGCELNGGGSTRARWVEVRREVEADRVQKVFSGAEALGPSVALQGSNPIQGEIWVGICL